MWTIEAGSSARVFPEAGKPLDEIDAILSALRAADEDPRATFGDRWLNDRGLLLDDGVIDIAKRAHLAFFTKNNSAPPVLEMESELVSMALELFHAGPGACGSLTSGGSESLFLATAAALANAELRQPEIIIAETGYPTFEKYGRYLGYRTKRVAADSNFKADPARMEDAVTGDTVMIVASLPSWSHGACDPVPELAEIARKHGLWLHVDACVGGFLAPFVRDLGRPLPDFDFRLAGVDSLSADFHKYGYGAKGVSGLFFRDRRRTRGQAFVFDRWPAGLYRSPVFTGTRSGGAIAAAWAVARYLGREGYRRRARQILKLRDALVAFAATSGLTVLAGAELATVAIAAEGLNIYAVAAGLRVRRWNINLLQAPAALQFVLGPVRDEYIELLLDDLAAAVADAQAGRHSEAAPRVVYSDEIPDHPHLADSE
jgi:sphinganine-1-phosphate aldolase